MRMFDDEMIMLDQLDEGNTRLEVVSWRDTPDRVEVRCSPLDGVGPTSGLEMTEQMARWLAARLLEHADTVAADAVEDRRLKAEKP